MNLGSILQNPSEPVVSRVVEFHVLTMTPDGTQGRAKARAALVFVSEAQRQDALRDAAANLPRGGNLEDEENYWVLMAALRDADNPVMPFVPGNDVKMLKSALIIHQVRWLIREYKRFVDDEYPELITIDQKQDLEEQARGN